MRIEIILSDVIIFISVFARVGALTMLMPVFSYGSVPMRIRLYIALAISLILMPVVGFHFNDLSSDFAIITTILGELFIGLLLGGLIRLSLSALDIAGTVIAYQSGMALAIIVDPANNGQQSSIFTGFLTILALMLIMSFNLHHVMIAGIKNSYQLFIPGQFVSLEQFAVQAIDLISKAFVVAFQISAPFIFFSLLFNVGLAIISRLMPQFQVFFVAMPLNIMLCFALFMVLISVMMEHYLEFFSSTLQDLLFER